MKLEASTNDVSDLKQQLELKLQEIKSLGATAESLRNTNIELEVCFFSASPALHGH